MSYVVIGASGFIGKALVRSLTADGQQVHGTYYSRARRGTETVFDLFETNVTRMIERMCPEAVFLTARAPLMATDSDWIAAVGSLAAAACRAKARLVTFSSNEVFGRNGGPCTESEEPHPTNRVGRRELEIERVVRKTSAANLIIRTADVFGWDHESANIAMRVWNALSAGDFFAASDDEMITPTSVDYLVEVCARLVHDTRSNLVHVTSGGQTTPFQFSRQLAKAFGFDPESVRVTTAHDGLQRTARSTLVMDKAVKLLSTPPPGLDVGIRGVKSAYLAEMQPVRQVQSSEDTDRIRVEILDKVAQYQDLIAAKSLPFTPFKSRIHYAGRVYGKEEMVNLVDSALAFQLTVGPYTAGFEHKMRTYLDSYDAVAVSSGSAANLTAFLALMSFKLEWPLRPGDEVITPAVTFPTTLTPIVHSGAVPVFVDCEVGTYNIDPTQLAGAVSERTRAIVIPHTLGNPCDMDVVMQVANDYQLFVLEDACDALGSTFRGKLVGTFGNLGTLSFYPAHHITTGEGGCVIVNDQRIGRIVRAVRDWGRDCWCGPGEDNACGKRFGWQCGDLPQGYDHKYIFSSIGYNFKPTEMQAAIGTAQFNRLPSFIESRKRNFIRLYEGLRPHAEQLVLPTLDPRSDPSWFGFPITVKPGWSRSELIRWLEKANIETRLIFAGNILRQPAFREIPHRIAYDLHRTDEIMNRSFFIGVYPGLTMDAIDFMIERFHDFFGRQRRSVD